MVLLLLALIPLAVLGTIIYKQTTDISTKTTQDFLLTIVKSKDAALENYIDTTKTIGSALAETAEFQQYLELTNKELNADEIAQLEDIKIQVNDLLYSFQETHWERYHHIFLIDNNKKITVSPEHGASVKGTPSSHLNEDAASNVWAMQALFQGTTAVSDYSSWIESDHSHQMLFYPVKNSNGTTQAVIGFELQIPYEQEILTRNFHMGETGRIFLATADGVPIVYKGIEDQVPLNTPGLIEAQSSGLSIGLRPNTKGVEVIDLYLKNDTYPWILVAEVEAEEAFSGMNTIQLTMLGGFITTFIVIVILSIMFANFIVNPIKQMTKQMVAVSLGKLDIQIDNMERKDEIGKLAQAFNRVIVSLRIAMKNYQKN